MTNVVNVLVVDDSTTTRKMLTGLINSTPGMRVVGEALDGEQAVRMAIDLRPNLILMDLTMPKMNGVEATSQIMHRAPTPIVMVSASIEAYVTDVAFEAMNAGALMLMPKPNPFHDEEIEHLINTMRAMAQVKVIHHAKPAPKIEARGVQEVAILTAKNHPEIIAIGASTGGPAALSEILSGLPANFPVPVVITQHIAADFVSSMAQWLNTVTPLRVEVAQIGDMPRPGVVYIAPGDRHLQVTVSHRFLITETPQTAYMPSCDIFLKSVAKSYGDRAIGMVLTGMGDDGARGLRAMYEAGAFTIAQDESTSVVYGMPRAAAELGGVCQVMPLPGIASALVQLCTQEQSS
jgi:two-component system, chemotaxis family, protein-glutamate methylesterase/glutaminase